MAAMDEEVDALRREIEGLVRDFSARCTMIFEHLENLEARTPARESARHRENQKALAALAQVGGVTGGKPFLR